MSVPSVEDQEIFNISEQAFDEADRPDDVYLGICHSIPFNNKKKVAEITGRIQRKNISQKTINFYRNLGVGYGRRGAMSMYSGQDYVLQIDGHTNFCESWDSALLDMYHSVPSEMSGGKHMLTAYLPGYEILENNVRYSPDDYIPRYPCYSSWRNIGHGQGIDEMIKRRDSRYPSIPWWLSVRTVPGTYDTSTDKKPILLESNNASNFLPDGYSYCRKINANFIFTDNRIINHYDDIYKWEYKFFEEEFIGSIEAFAAGYMMIFPNIKLPLAHLYVDWYNEFYDESSRGTVEPNNEEIRKTQQKTEKYLSDPNNQEKIKNYCNYAGLTFPEFESVDTFYIPWRKYED